MFSFLHLPSFSIFLTLVFATPDKFISEKINYLKMSYNLTEGALARICAQQDEVQNAVVQVLGQKAINVSNQSILEHRT